MKRWIYSKTYHLCMRAVLWVCRRDALYAALLYGEGKTLCDSMGVCESAKRSAWTFISSLRGYKA